MPSDDYIKKDLKQLSQDVHKSRKLQQSNTDTQKLVGLDRD